MSREVRTLAITPALWRDQPEMVGRIVAEKLDEHPDAFWLLLVGEREEAQGFIDTQLFHFSPAEEVE